MMGFNIITIMQLRNKLDLSKSKSKKSIIISVVLSVLKFAIISGLIYLAFYLISYMRLVSILPGIPSGVFSVVFTIMFILSIVISSLRLNAVLFFAKDNQFLFTLPVERAMVFLSKLVVYYLQELYRNVFYLLPLFLAYGFINNLTVFFYLWVVLMLPILTAFSVVVASIFTVPLVYLSMLLKRHSLLKTILWVVAIVSLVVVVVMVIGAIPTNIDIVGTWGTTFWQIQSFINNFNKVFAVFGFISEMVIGSRYAVSNSIFYGRQFLILAVLLLVIAVLILVVYYIVRPIFFKVVSSGIEYKSSYRKKSLLNSKNPVGVSLIKKEWLDYVRSGEKLYPLLTIVILMPIAILLLNKLYGAMDIRLTGANMTKAFNILMILLFAMSSNTKVATIYSRDGASGYLLNVVPVGYVKLLFSRLVINIFLVTISILISVYLFSSFSHISFLGGLQIFLVIEMLYLGHLFLSADLDIMNPVNSHFDSAGNYVNSPSEIKSAVWLFVLSIIFAFLTYFFITENSNLVWLRLMLFASIFLFIRIWLFCNRAKLNFQERL